MRGFSDFNSRIEGSVADFWMRVLHATNETECWMWDGAKNGAGYGQIRRDGRMRYAHRIAYELDVGPIPDGLVIDHLCREPSCVNPGHMEAVTEKVNILRGTAPSAVHARKTHCAKGHDYTTKQDGSRYCSACANERRRSLHG